MSSAPSQVPSFLILGAAKAGTTALHSYLEEHPDIYMSEPKEPFFFEAEYDRGIEFYRERYFGGWRGERASGESRHRNLFLPYVPTRIARTLPHARFIILVRDPVERAFSHYWHWHVRGRETLSFELALMRNLERLWRGPTFQEEAGIQEYVRTLGPDGWSPYRTYLDSGYYAEQLERYRRLFGPDRIKVLVFEEFVADPQRALDELWPFLGVEPFELEKLPIVNRSVSPGGERALEYARDLSKWMPVPALLKRKTKAFLRRVAPSRPTMSAEVRAHLVAHFEPEVRRLESLLSRSLDLWKSGSPGDAQAS